MRDEVPSLCLGFLSRNIISIWVASDGTIELLHRIINDLFESEAENLKLSLTPNNLLSEDRKLVTLKNTNCAKIHLNLVSENIMKITRKVNKVVTLLSLKITLICVSEVPHII